MGRPSNPAASKIASAVVVKDSDEDTGKKIKKGGKVKQVKILRTEDRVDPLTGLKRSKGYGFLEMHAHADALRFIRWVNANMEVHALFQRWWIEDLKVQMDRLEMTKDSSDKEARMKRMKDRLEELKNEDVKKVARQGKTLIVEFAVENAITVKRREEKVSRAMEKGKKRKREEEAAVEEKARAETLAVARESQAQEEKDKSRNTLGSVIGKKRRLAKVKKGK